MPYKNKEDQQKRSKQYYWDTKEQRQAYAQTDAAKIAARLRDLKRRTSRKKEIVELAGGKCTDCHGVFPLACYDFHHLDPSKKEFDPCSGLTKKKEKLFAEIQKCILLCANCHRVRHAAT